MKHINEGIITMLILLTAAVLFSEAEKIESDPLEIQLIRRANRSHSINDDYYVTYSWASRPRIGQNVLIVKLLDENRNQVQDLEISAVSSMPEMSCCPDSEEQFMRLNRNGDYLLPINFTMLGDWEVILSFWQDEEFVTNARIKHHLR